MRYSVYCRLLNLSDTAYGRGIFVNGKLVDHTKVARIWRAIGILLYRAARWAYGPAEVYDWLEEMYDGQA